MKIFDRYIVPVVRWVEDRIRMPFGQSVFIVRGNRSPEGRGQYPPASRATTGLARRNPMRTPGGEYATMQ